MSLFKKYHGQSLIHFYLYLMGGLTLALFPLLRTVGAESSDFSGSLSFQASQRFYNKASLGHVNGSSPWGAISYTVDFGLFEWKGFEPRLGMSFAKNSTYSASTTFAYQLWSGRGGMRYKPYDFHYFPVIPYFDVDLVATMGRGYQKSGSTAREKRRVGNEVGVNLGAGALISFLTDAETRHELQSEWSIKDYGLLAGLEWMKGGLVTSGRFFGLVKESSYWSFHLGLMIDW